MEPCNPRALSGSRAGSRSWLPVGRHALVTEAAAEPDTAEWPVVIMKPLAHEAQKMRVDMLANETAAAEKVETLARKMQELTKEEQATRDAAAEEMPAWLLEAEEIVATTRRV